MIQAEAVSFSAAQRSFFPRLWGEKGCCCACVFLECLVAHKSDATEKGKTTPAHQGKFPLTPSSPYASAFTAHTVKGRCALRSALLLFAPDLLARLRPALLTTAAPGEIYPQGRSSAKAANAIPAFPPGLLRFPCTPLAFSRSSCQLSPSASCACRVSLMRFPPVRSVLSGISAFAFLMRCIRLPHVGLFVRHHPGGPGYVSYRRSASYFTPGRWLRPLDPRRKAQRLEKP